jgi:acyl-CoA synthetase (NDP forming)
VQAEKFNKIFGFQDISFIRAMTLEKHMMLHSQMKDVVMAVLDAYMKDNLKKGKDINILLNGDMKAKEIFLKWQQIKKNCIIDRIII